MEPDVKDLLEENLKLSKENKELLKKIYKIQRWIQISKAIYLLIIIGFFAGAFYFIQPLVNQVLDVYSGGFQNLKSSIENKEVEKDWRELIREVNQ
jgi:uncharacterized membrane protein YukC